MTPPGAPPRTTPSTAGGATVQLPRKRRDPAHGAAPGSAPTGARRHDRRADVQGLRAIAVGLVVVAHVRPDLLGGGFVGVDVFFVISGFLITGLLLREAETTGRVRLAAFWARRVQRLVPAATLVLVSTLAVSALVLPRSRWTATAHQAIASSTSVQNLLLAHDAVDYWAAHAAASPFQHFWSLSVEEQFYVAWPVLLVGVVAVARRTGGPGRRLRAGVGAVAAAVLVASLLASVHLTSTHPATSYFDPRTRAWELAVGALLAVVAPRGAAPSAPGGPRAALLPPPIAPLVGTAGLAAIAVAAWRDAGAAFPGLAAALPVLGAAAVLAAGSPRVLGVAPLRYLGDCSYSLYLWHWPVLVLYLVRSRQGAVGWRGALVVVAVSVVLAVATRELVEEPVRRARLTAGPGRVRHLLPVVALGAACVTVTATVSAGMLGAVAHERRRLEASATGPDALHPGAAAITPGGVRRVASAPLVPDPAVAVDDDPLDHRPCQQNASSAAVLQCSFGPARAARTIAVVGDSHATRWVPAFTALAARDDFRVVLMSKGSCSYTTPRQAWAGAEYATCTAWVPQVTRDLERLHPDVVVTSDFATRTLLDVAPGRPTTDALVAGYRSLWGQLQRHGMRVVAVRDTPEMGEQVADCLGSHASDPTACDRPRAQAVAAVDPAVVAARGMSGVGVLDLVDSFCTATTCPAQAGNVVAYMDDSHMTATWSRTLAPALQRQLVALGVVAS